MDPTPADFCQNGHIGSLLDLAHAQRVMTLAEAGRLAPIRELPGRSGRGYFCGTCSAPMHPHEKPFGPAPGGSTPA